MNPLDYASPDVSLYTWAPPPNPARSLGPRICLVQPHFAGMSSGSADARNGAVVCTGRIRTHLHTPHAGSCPLDYTPLFVALHRRQKEKLLLARVNRPVPLLGRSGGGASAQSTRWPPAVVAAAAVVGRRPQQHPSPTLPSSQNVMETAAAIGQPVRASASAHPTAFVDGLVVVERAVPPSVAAVMAQVTAAATTTATAAAPAVPVRVSPASPHHHHHHHRHSSRPRPSTETRAPSTQQSPVIPQHHHHHHQTATATAVFATPQQHMRYRVGRSGSTQLQPLPSAANDAAGVGVGAAGVVAAAAAEAAAREVASSVRPRRSASPFSAHASSASASRPREASTATPRSLGLSSIRRSGTRGSSLSLSSAATAAAAVMGVASGMAALNRLPRPMHHRGSRSPSHEQSTPYLNPRLRDDDDDGDVETALAPTSSSAMVTPNGLADTRMFLRPPRCSLREERADYGSDDAHATLLLVGSPGTASSLYRSAAAATTTMATTLADTVEDAAAASAEQQRELQLQLQRALQRQQRLERLMFHDGDDENTLGGLDGAEGGNDSSASGDAAPTDGTEGRLSSVHRCRSGTGWDDGLGDDPAEDEPLWRSAPPHAHTGFTVASTQPQPPQQQLERRVPSVHPHAHISLSRFHETSADREDESGLGIRADSMREVPREWAMLMGHGRSATTSPSPQPDPSWADRQRRQQRRDGRGGDGSEADTHHPSQLRHRRYQFSSSATTVEGSPVPIPATSASTTSNSNTTAATARAAVSRSAAMAPTSANRGGSVVDRDGTRDASPSFLSVVTAALRGASSRSYTSSSLSQPHPTTTTTTRGRDAAVEEVEFGSPTLPSPIHPVPASRLSMPNAAFTDIVSDMAQWSSASVDRADGEAAVATVAPAAATSLPARPQPLPSLAGSSSSSSSSPSWRHSCPQVEEMTAVACTRRPMRIAAESEDDEEAEEETLADDDPSDEVVRMAETRTALSSSDADFAHRQGSPSPAQLRQDARAMRRQSSARWARTSCSADDRNSTEKAAAAASSSSRPTSYGSDSPSPTVGAEVARRSVLSSDSFCAMDAAAENGVPAVRRTSPGVSAPSSKCTRFSAEDYDRSSSAGSHIADAVDVEGKVWNPAERSADREVPASVPNASSSASPSPQQQEQQEPPDDATTHPLASTPVASTVVESRSTTVTSAPAAAAAAPMVYLSDMLRLSFSPARDEDDAKESFSNRDTSAAESNRRLHAEVNAATPRNFHQPSVTHCFSRCDNDKDGADVDHELLMDDLSDRYPQRSSCYSGGTATAQRSGVATASISSSPPSPHRTAIRHAACLLSEEEEEEEADENNSHDEEEKKEAVRAVEQQQHLTPMNCRTPVPSFHPVVAGNTSDTATPLTPTAIASRLALSTEERRLHASTASTVAWGTTATVVTASSTVSEFAFPTAGRTSLTQPRFSDDSVLSAVFSTPAQTLLQSLLQASAWAASPNHDEGGEEREVNGMSTPRRDLHRGSALSPSGVPRSPATPLQHRQNFDDDDSPAYRVGRGSEEAAGATPMTAPPLTEAMKLPPPPPRSSVAAALPGASMPPPSPFRGSGSFLHVQPIWSGGLSSTAAAAEEGRPSDGFGADMQLLARRTRVTVGGGGGGGHRPPGAAFSPPTPIQQVAQRAAPSPPSSPGRFSTNSLSFFIAAAAPAAAVEDDEQRAAMRSGSGLYGSAMASRRSWAPRKARPQRRGKQRRASGRGRPLSSRVVHSASPSRSQDPYHPLRFSAELTSPSPSARPSRGDSSSGVFLPPQRLTFGSAVPSLATHVTSSTTAGFSDSGERWSTALSTPTTLALHQQQQQQGRRQPRRSPPSYDEALRAQSSEPRPCGHLELSDGDEASGDGLRSPSLSSVHYQDPAAQPSLQQQSSLWMHPSSLSPSAARTPSGRPSLSSSEFLRAPQRGPREIDRRSWTPSVNALPAYPSILNVAVDPVNWNSNHTPSPARQRSLSTSGGSSEYQRREGFAPRRRPRRANRAASFSLFRSSSAGGMRLTWGTAASATSSSSEARTGALAFSPSHGGRSHSSSRSIHFSSGCTTPLRVSQTRTSGPLTDLPFTAVPTTATTTGAVASLADELRSFSSPLFGPPAPPSAPVAVPVAAASSQTLPTTTFLASPPRRSAVQLPLGASFLAAPQSAESAGGSSSGGGPSSTSLPPELQALLMRGSVTATAAAVGGRVVGPVTQPTQNAIAEQEFQTPRKAAPASEPETASSSSSPLPLMKTPQQRRGCSERPEVNVEYGAASPSPSRQASP